MPTSVGSLSNLPSSVAHSVESVAASVLGAAAKSPLASQAGSLVEKLLSYSAGALSNRFGKFLEGPGKGSRLSGSTLVPASKTDAASFSGEEDALMTGSMRTAAVSRSQAILDGQQMMASIRNSVDQFLKQLFNQ